jgi:glycosyltransferase involved in cell wall biosynthesis
MTILFIDGASKGGIEKSIEIYSDSLNRLGIDSKIICYSSKSKTNSNYFYFDSIQKLLSYISNNDIENIIFFKNYSKFFWIKFFVKSKIFVRSSNTPTLLIWDFTLKRFLAEFFKLLTYNFSDFIISNSIENSTLLRKLYFRPVVTIRNFESPSKRLTLPKFASTTFIFVSRIEKQKNPFLVIEAFYLALKINPKLRLIIIGDGSELIYLKKLVNQFGIEYAIRFEIFGVDKSHFLSQAHCAIFSSKYEGLPNVLLEYMSYDLPILYNECKTGVRELMQNYNLGIKYDFQNKFSLAKKLVDFNFQNFVTLKSNSKEILGLMKEEFNQNIKNIFYNGIDSENFSK